MKFSISSKKIIPSDPFYLMGYVDEERNKPALGIEDDPECNTVLLEIEHNKILFVVLDVVVISRAVSTMIKTMLHNKYGLETENITIAAIHSHSCANGTSAHGFNEHETNPDYLETICTAISESVAMCLETAQTAVVHYQVDSIQGFYSNRNDINAPYDNQVKSLIFYDLHQNCLGTIANIACHSTVLGPKNRYASYDLLGTIRAKMKAQRHAPVLMTMAAAGDISNRQYRQGDDFKELERVAQGIFEQLEYPDTGRLVRMDTYASREFGYEISYDNTTNYDRYRQLLASIEDELRSPEITRDQYKLDITSQVILRQKLTVEWVDKKIFVKTMKLGDVYLVMFGGELSSVLGREILNLHPESPTMIVTCADDHQGYYIEADKYGLYYETISTDVPMGEPEKIVAKICREINNLV